MKSEAVYIHAIKLELCFVLVCNIGLYALLAYGIYATDSLWPLLGLIMQTNYTNHTLDRRTAGKEEGGCDASHNR